MENKKAVFTWGYHSRALRHLEGVCKVHNIRWVVDVRRKPYSVQPGWDYKELGEFWADKNTTYRHYGGLGNYQPDLPWRRGPEKIVEQSLEWVRGMLLVGNVLLLCRETNHFECHRKEVAEAIAEGRDIEVRHLGDMFGIKAAQEVREKARDTQLNLFGVEEEDGR
jgi:uncharacterized protein (DUF488 family)